MSAFNDDHEVAVPKGVKHVMLIFLETHQAAGRSSRRKAHARDLIEVFSLPRLTRGAKKGAQHHDPYKDVMSKGDIHVPSISVPPLPLRPLF